MESQTNDIRFSFSVGKDNLSDINPNQAECLVSFGLQNVQKKIEEFKAETNGLADYYTIVLKFESDLASTLEGKIQEQLKIMKETDFFEDFTVEVSTSDSQIFIKLNFNEEQIEELKKELNKVMKELKNFENVNGSAHLSLQSSANSMDLYNDINSKVNPLPRLLDGFRFALHAQGPRSIFRQWIEDYAASPRGGFLDFHSICPVAWLFNGTSFDLSFSSSRNLPESVRTYFNEEFSFDFPDSDYVDEEELTFMKFLSDIGKQIRPKLSFYMITKFFAVEAKVSVVGLSEPFAKFVARY